MKFQGFEEMMDEKEDGKTIVVFNLQCSYKFVEIYNILEYCGR